MPFDDWAINRSCNKYFIPLLTIPQIQSLDQRGQSDERCRELLMDWSWTRDGRWHQVVVDDHTGSRNICRDLRRGVCCRSVPWSIFGHCSFPLRLLRKQVIWITDGFFLVFHEWFSHVKYIFPVLCSDVSMKADLSNLFSFHSSSLFDFRLILRCCDPKFVWQYFACQWNDVL